MNYALIGCGRIAPNHITAAKANNLNIVALCDIAAENAQKLVQRFNLGDNVKIYQDYKQAIIENKIELVSIATESGKHAQIALDCINAGVNVIIEKPIALSIADADEIISASKLNNIKVCACHQNRFNKSVQKMKNAVDMGRFGRLFNAAANIRWNRGYDYYAQAKWRGTWEQDGGALMNQCVHNIDLLRWIMGGNIDEVFAYSSRQNHPYIEAEDLGVSIVKFSNGALGIVEGTTNVFPSNFEETLYVFGEKGTVKLGGKSINTIEEWHFADETDTSEEIKAKFSENPPDVYGFGHTPLYADVIDAIKNNRTPYVTAEDGKQALELVLAIYKSAAIGKPVKLPIKNCSTLDFKGRF